MRIKILGYNGSIGADRHTPSSLTDDDMLLDAGTGVGTLPLEEIRRIVIRNAQHPCIQFASGNRHKL